MQTILKKNKTEFRRIVQVHEDKEGENSYILYNKLILIIL